MPHGCPHCGEDDDSVVPSAKACYLDWNGRFQFTGVVDLNGARKLLDDKWGDLEGPGRVLTPDEFVQVTRRVEQENCARVTDDTPSLADLHVDLANPAKAAEIRLHASERDASLLEDEASSPFRRWWDETDQSVSSSVSSSSPPPPPSNRATTRRTRW